MVIVLVIAVQVVIVLVIAVQVVIVLVITVQVVIVLVIAVQVVIVLVLAVQVVILPWCKDEGKKNVLVGAGSVLSVGQTVGKQEIVACVSRVAIL